jgi:hypothetical protein
MHLLYNTVQNERNEVLDPNACSIFVNSSPPLCVKHVECISNGLGRPVGNSNGPTPKRLSCFLSFNICSFTVMP